MNIITGKIKYALRDEILNIFAMTYGDIPTVNNKQIMICKKKKFAADRLGPFLLDPKISKPVYIKLKIGMQYEVQIQSKKFELKYIAFIEDQIEIRPSLTLFQELKLKGIFSLWEPEAPFKYFEGHERGYLILFRVYELGKEVNESFLEKGRSGRNYYYGLAEEVNYETATPVMDDITYNKIKSQIVEIVNRYNHREEVTYIETQEKIGTIIPERHVAEVTLFTRNQKVSEYVKKRANGYCECCGKPAPFVKDNGEQYLEEHHLVALCEGGEDTVDNVCAVCPNCHRELYYGVDRSIIKEGMYMKLKQM